MNEAVISKSLRELCDAISFPANSPVAQKHEGVYTHVEPEQCSMEESLAHLQLQIKYLLFDLEATRRENRYLRQMLEYHRRGQVDGEAREE